MFKLWFLPPMTAIMKQVFLETVLGEIDALTCARFNTLERQYSEEELVKAIPDFDICVTGWQSPRFTKRVINRAQNLKLILHSAGTLKPYIDPLVFRKKILVTSSKNVIAEITAESALAMMMIGNWEVKKWMSVIEQGGWKERDSCVPGIQGNTIGLIGLGAITRALLSLLKPFQDVRILVSSLHLGMNEARALGVEKIPLEQLLIESDIISLQTSLNKETYRLLNASNMKLIKEGALLINIGRGDLIDEQALLQLLEEGRFRAVLDVFAEEPPLPRNPLRDLPNVVSLPHLGAATRYCRQRMGRDVLDNLKDFLEGRTLRSLISEAVFSGMSEY